MFCDRLLSLSFISLPYDPWPPTLPRGLPSTNLYITPPSCPPPFHADAQQKSSLGQVDRQGHLNAVYFCRRPRALRQTAVAARANRRAAAITSPRPARPIGCTAGRPRDQSAAARRDTQPWTWHWLLGKYLRQRDFGSSRDSG